jgi:hypothetical protein
MTLPQLERKVATTMYQSVAAPRVKPAVWAPLADARMSSSAALPLPVVALNA